MRPVNKVTLGLDGCNRHLSRMQVPECSYTCTEIDGWSYKTLIETITKTIHSDYDIMKYYEM